jgi:hypothetical protein
MLVLSFVVENKLPIASTKVQLASMQFPVKVTSLLLEHWHVVLASVHPTAGIVSAKHDI